MRYEYANLPSYEDFAAGRALHHAPGLTNFPARLAIELMGRCLAQANLRAPAVVYDPLCGAGALITVAAIAHAGRIGRVRGTDADARAIEVARRNAALLASGGLEARAQALEEMGARFGRDSYAGAAASARRLARMLPADGIPAEAFCADAFSLPRDGFYADIILTDLPYGDMTNWAAGDAERFLPALRSALAPGGVVCVVADKGQTCAGEGFVRVARGNVGKRRFEMFRLCDETSEHADWQVYWRTLT